MISLQNTNWLYDLPVKSASHCLELGSPLLMTTAALVVGVEDGRGQGFVQLSGRGFSSRGLHPCCSSMAERSGDNSVGNG